MSGMRIVVVGAGGRMGRTLITKVLETPGISVSAAIDLEKSSVIGEDIGRLVGRNEFGISVSDDPVTAFADADGVLDFTSPQATVQYVELSAQARIVHVIGTTGFTESDERKIEAASRHARIVKSGNMSLGVNLLAGLVKQAARSLDEEYDIEILEMHHRHKVDAPSGTAKLFGQSAALGRGIELKERSILERVGQTGIRTVGDIGFATLRGGTVVGSHAVVFAGQGEVIELSHKAEDRGIFALGAIKAAIWAKDKSPGLYSMSDVLGL